MSWNYWFTMFYTLLGGLGLFLFGMKNMSQSLQSLGSPVIRKTINFVTANRVFAVLVGTLITCLVQSSSVSTVMMSGFVNAGLMDLTQATGFIFGANIGTTITGWIISLKIGKYGLLLIGLGVGPMLFARNNTIKNVARLIFALGLVFFGLEFMSDAFKPLRTNPDFHKMMTYFTATNPFSVLACFGIGCALTMIIQSSSAMLGITIALATQGAIGFPTAAALVLGENIGTTITLWLASIGATTCAKRTALSHSMFNILGSLLVFTIFSYYIDFINWMMPGSPTKAAADGTFPAVAAHIVAVHTVFNVSMTVLFLPFLPYLVRLVEFIIPERRGEGKERFLHFATDVRSVTISPVMALQEARMVLNKMVQRTRDALDMTFEFLLDEHRRGDLAGKIREIEDEADVIQKEMMLFLSRLMSLELEPDDARAVNAMIRSSDELESVTDYCVNVVKYRERLFENNIQFNTRSHEELAGFIAGVSEYFEVCSNWARNGSGKSLDLISMMQRELNLRANQIRDEHLDMIRDGNYPPIFGLTFSDIMIAIRRIKNHSMNIAEAWNE